MSIETILIPFITSCILMAVAFLLQKKPQFISGYSQLSEQQRNSPEFKQWALNLKKYLLLAALIILVGCTISALLHNEPLYLAFLIVPTLIMVVVSVITLRRILTKKQYLKNVIALILVLSLLAIPLFDYCHSSTKITIYNDTLSIIGMYGREIPLSQIRQISLTKNLPQISQRTNGYSFNGVKLGHFRTTTGIPILLFLQKDQSPYIFIQTNSGENLYFNEKDTNITLKTYHQIHNKIGNSTSQP